MCSFLDALKSLIHDKYTIIIDSQRPIIPDLKLEAKRHSSGFTVVGGGRLRPKGVRGRAGRNTNREVAGLGDCAGG